VLIEQFINVRNQFFDRKKIRGVELFIEGSGKYLEIFNEGEQKSQLVDEVLRQMHCIGEAHLGEFKIQMK
jgi:hypothetical protein